MRLDFKNRSMPVLSKRTIPLVKALVVSILGRPLTNRLAKKPYDWLAALRTQRFLKQLPKRELLINLGCGERPLPGWVNLDIAREPHVDVVWDLRRGLPFPDRSCQGILSEHVIEHMSRLEGVELLAECYRVLRPGGALRLSTPDGAKYLKAYVDKDSFILQEAARRGAKTMMDHINILFREEGLHLWIYDAESLMQRLRSVGFQRVLHSGFGESTSPLFAGIDDPTRSAQSLYVEAHKNGCL